jgi:hypothetical protein
MSPRSPSPSWITFHSGGSFATLPAEPLARSDANWPEEVACYVRAGAFNALRHRRNVAERYYGDTPLPARAPVGECSEEGSGRRTVSDERALRSRLTKRHEGRAGAQDL